MLLLAKPLAAWRLGRLASEQHGP